MACRHPVALGVPLRVSAPRLACPDGSGSGWLGLAFRLRPALAATGRFLEAHARRKEAHDVLCLLFMQQVRQGRRNEGSVWETALPFLQCHRNGQRRKNVRPLRCRAAPALSRPSCPRSGSPGLIPCRCSHPTARPTACPSNRLSNCPPPRIVWPARPHSPRPLPSPRPPKASCRQNKPVGCTCCRPVGAI